MTGAEALQLLDVAYGASADEIKRAWRNKAKEVHPDVNPSPDAATQFTRLTEARDHLLLEDDYAPPTPPSQAERYQPAPPKVDDAQRDKLLQELMRKREAQKRHERRRSQGVKARARRAERESEERLRQAEQRRREREVREQRERSAAEAPLETPPVPDREAEAAQAEQERLAELQREEAARQERQPRHPSAARPARAPRRPQPVDREEPLAPAPARAASGPLGRCAWKGCEISQDLAEPISTALGLRRFCEEHREAYREMNAARAQPRRRSVRR